MAVVLPLPRTVQNNLVDLVGTTAAKENGEMIMQSQKLVAIVLFVILASFSVAVGAGDTEGTVEGVFTYNEKAVNLPHVYIWPAEEGFYDKADPTWTLLFVENPIEERELDDIPWDTAFISLGVTKTVGYPDDPESDEPQIKIIHQYLRASADFGGNSAGGEYPMIELSQAGPDRFVGRVFHDGTQEFSDDTFHYDFSFDAPLSDPNAPIGDPLPAGGGEPGAAYLAWCDAILSGDIEKFKGLVPDEQAAMLDDPEIQAGFKEDLEFMQAMTPADVVIVGGSSDGEIAILDVTGTMEGEAVKGEITLTRQGDKWISTGEAWQ